MDTNDQGAVAPETTEQVESAEVVEATETTNEAPDYEFRVKELEKTVADLTGKLKRATKKDSPTSSEKKQSDGLDYGMKAYLRAEGIEPTEFDFVQEQMRESGLELENLVKNGYFQSQLKERRDQKAVENATPSATRNTGESPRTQVEYWIEKDELPPNTPENVELRRQVLNKKLERAKGSTNFSRNPIVMQ